MSGYFLDISLKAIHVGSGIDECDVVLEIDDAFSFRKIVDSDIELIQSILEDILGTLLNVTRFCISPFFLTIVAIECILEIIVEFLHVILLVDVLMFNLIFDLKPNFFY